MEETDARVEGESSPVPASRSSRTRDAIVAAFVSLCAEKGFDGVSVTGLARRARVNRASFYRHFESLDDLLERGIEGFLAEASSRVDAPRRPAGEGFRDSALRRMAAMFGAVAENRAFFLALLNGKARTSLEAKLRDFAAGFIEERRIPELEAAGFALPRDKALAASVMAAIFLACASWWLEKGSSVDSGEMAEIYLGFLTRGVAGSAFLRAGAASSRGR